NPTELTTARVGSKGLLGDYASAFFLTLTNPLTIISFAAIFAGVGVGQTAGDYSLAGLLVFGVFIGSMLWWLILSRMVTVLRSRFDQKRLKWVNQFSGIIIAAFGLISVIIGLAL
ncbi:MAG: homoserine/Threonine efflux protein, partial [Sporomusa sp.]|nr:homoserine/Threonine efflux protein [Sporomusa sp.]